MSALRISVPGMEPRLIREPDPYHGLTQRQRHVYDVVLAYNGNRSRAARHLGVTMPAVQVVLRACVKAGLRPPPAISGRRGRPDLKPRPPRHREGRS